MKVTYYSVVRETDLGALPARHRNGNVAVKFTPIDEKQGPFGVLMSPALARAFARDLLRFADATEKRREGLPPVFSLGRSFGRCDGCDSPGCATCGKYVR